MKLRVSKNINESFNIVLVTKRLITWSVYVFLEKKEIFGIQPALYSTDYVVNLYEFRLIFFHLFRFS